MGRGSPRPRRPAGLLAVGLAAAVAAGCGGPDEDEAGNVEMAQGPLEAGFEGFHGFNLLGRFDVDSHNGGFEQEDFELAARLGFNFIRLPLDYRTYTASGDWLAFDERVLRNVDEAVGWGRKHGIHVCLALHRGPGYSVADPPEPTSLWEDEATQQAFLAHWEMFAARYADEPPEALSFNLLNEPCGVADEVYGAFMEPVIAAIRAHGPGRPIVSDGLDHDHQPSAALAGSDVVQSLRGYQPYSVTHYRASWVDGAEGWPEPVWPVQPTALAAYFFGSYKPEYQSPLEVRHALPQGTKLILDVHQVSILFELEVRANDTTIWTKRFEPGPGSGEWSEVVYSERWDTYQNVYDRTYEVILPEAADSVSIVPGEGDWLTINEIVIDDGAERLVFTPDDYTFGARQTAVRVTEAGVLRPVGTAGLSGRDWLRQDLQAWLDYRADGGRIFVGEMGVYNETPHAIALAWLEDLLSLYQEEGIGWALWNLRGSFGILDSGRADVRYVRYRGHDLDRDMLALLQKYR